MKRSYVQGTRLLVLSLCLLGCLGVQHRQSSLHKRTVLPSSKIRTRDSAPLPITEITLDRARGMNPSDPDYELILRNDGTAIKYYPMDGECHAHISSAAFRQLAQFILQCDFGNYEPIYGMLATDIPTVTTGVVYQGHRKTVVQWGADGQGFRPPEISAPEELRQIENRIDAVVAHVHWVKVSDNRYPYAQADGRFYFGKWLIPKTASRQQLNKLLILAIDRENASMVKTLLARGANPNTLKGLERIVFHGQPVKDAKAPYPDRHWTALMVAAGTGNVTIVRLLLEAGADAKASNDGGYTALMKAARHASYMAEQKKHSLPPCAEIVKLLIEYGADVNAKDKDGDTALSECRNDPDVVTLLKQAGAKE